MRCRKEIREGRGGSGAHLEGRNEEEEERCSLSGGFCERWELGFASLRLTPGMASLPCSSSSWCTHLSMGTDHRIFLESWIPEVLGKDRQERQRAEVTCPT